MSRWKDQTSIGYVHAYRQTRLERFLERTVPYLPFVFKNKRERVRCRWRFRYAYLQRLDDDLMAVLGKMQAKTFDASKVDLDPLFDWEITLKNDDSRG